MRVFIANIYCGTVHDNDGRFLISSPSKQQVVDVGRVSLFSNDTGDASMLGRTQFYQCLCDLCGFNITILVADSDASPFNLAHSLMPNEVRFIDRTDSR